MPTLHPPLPRALAPAGLQPLAPGRRAVAARRRDGAGAEPGHRHAAHGRRTRPVQRATWWCRCASARCCWLIIDGGRHGVAALRNRWRLARGLPPGRPFGFPGLALDPGAGARWAWRSARSSATCWPRRSAATTFPGCGPLPAARKGITWLLTLLASAAAVLTLSLLERLAHARADAEARAPRRGREPAEAAGVAARAAHAVQHAGQPARADRHRPAARAGHARPADRLPARHAQRLAQPACTRWPPSSSASATTWR